MIQTRLWTGMDSLLPRREAWRMWFTWRYNKRWWLKEHSPEWHEWAVLASDGKILTFDEHGGFVRGTAYGTRRKAIAALQRMGYLRFQRRDRERFTPPALE